MTVLTRFGCLSVSFPPRRRINAYSASPYAPAGQDESLTTSSFAPASTFTKTSILWR